MKRYTLEDCKKVALKHDTRIDWIKADVNSYNAAWRYGWLKVCTKHMRTNYGQWTFALCLAKARKHPTRKALYTKDRNCYAAIIRKGWLKPCTKHMGKKKTGLV